MLDYWFIVAVGLASFLVYYFYQLTTTRKSTTIPGIRSSDPVQGNLTEIRTSGSLHQFLSKMHRSHGPIVSFWIGPVMYVSTASPKLFEEQIAAFDRPYDLYKYGILITGDDSIQVAKGTSGRKRHAAYSKCFNVSSVKKTCSILNKLSHRMMNSWSDRPVDELILLQREMFKFSISTILEASFGSRFEDQQIVEGLHNSYNVCWSDIEERLLGNLPEPGDGRTKLFEKNQKYIEQSITDAVRQRKENPPTDGEHLLIDAAIAMNMTESMTVADLITMFIGGFHTTGTLLTWAIYYLAVNQEIQSRARKEVQRYCDQIGDVTRLSTGAVEDLEYLQQILNETLRCSILAPYAARCLDEDTILGGHNVPAGTPIIQALGAVLHDPVIYPDPTRFDPDRFSSENKKNLKPFAFEPFGFAGKRKCPGYNFSMAEATVFLSYLLIFFKVTLAPGQVAEPVHGLVTKPKNDIWVSIEPVLD